MGGRSLSGGADQALFSIGSTSGVLTFQAAPNYEDSQDANTDNAYVVVVRATSGTGARVKTADQTITVTVMDEDEQPDTPAKPTVTATSGSSTSLDVSWTEPGLNGGPEITGYEMQYQSRASATDAWSAVVDWTHTGTTTTTAITGLTADTEYQVQVKALNGETPSAWSDYSDAVSTNAAADTPTTEVTIAADQPAFIGRLDWVTFTLTRTGDAAAALDVAVALTQDLALLASENLTQTVTFGAGNATATLTLYDFYFQTVTQEATLTATVEAGSGYAPGSPNTASTRIVSADPAVTASIEQTAYTFAEDATDATVAVILRTATGVPSPNTDINVSLSLKNIPGQAQVDVDFEALGRQLRFRPSDFTWDGAAFTARQEVMLAIVDDLFDEPDETLTLALERAAGTPKVVALRRADDTACSPNPARCDVTVTIVDNDAPVFPPTVVSVAVKSAPQSGDT